MKRLELYRELMEKDGFHAPIGRLLGYRIADIEPGKAIFKMDVSPELLNSNGVVQGGAIGSLADAAMGIAFGSLLEVDREFTTIEMKINYFKPVVEGSLIAIGKVVRKGRRIGYCECEIFKEGRSGGGSGSVAKAVSTLMII